ncbi:MAG: sodium-translocating pyrophosphatase, partial [Bacteroidales bacterium]|nr:sodium-translocating pyrophosphatase [Bacteroidales bacterium]
MKKFLSLLILLATPMIVEASEANLVVPDAMKSEKWLYIGFFITLIGVLFGFLQYKKVIKKSAHKSMLEVADVIYQTGKTYLIQQGKFLIILFLIVGSVIAFYFG